MDDTGPGSSSPNGGVAYTYRMGLYEVSREMITKANAAGTLGLALGDMSPYGGNVATHAAAGITWNASARFVNWLNTSNGHAPAYKFSLQPGEGGYDSNANLVLWAPGDLGYDPTNLYRNSNAFYFLPNEDEWYKAAFYSGSGSTYYDYATQHESPAIPISTASGTAPGTAVYAHEVSQGPADINQAGGLSHYGTMGQNGNVFEWLENAFASANDSPSEDRTTRGGSWGWGEFTLRSSFSTYELPAVSNLNVGLRIASVESVPEPSTAALLLGSGAMLLLRRRRASAL